MRRWDRAVFMEAVRAVCEGFSLGNDWGILASRIGRVIPWEFDYRYDKFVDQYPGQPLPLRTQPGSADGRFRASSEDPSSVTTGRGVERSGPPWNLT